MNAKSQISEDPVSRHFNSRPRILFIVDHPNWAHDFKTQNLARVLGNDYDVQKRYHDEVTTADLDRADLVVVYYWLQFEALKDLARAFERNSHKLVLGICSHWELEGSRREPGFAILRAYARAVFVNNLFLYREYQASFDVPVFYAPNGVDTNFFHARPREEPASLLRVGWAGSLTSFDPGYKGYYDLIVPAVNALPGVELISAAREERRRSPEEMRDFYQSLDIYICASRAEGTPNPCLEAAACGVPLLTTRVGNMPELVLHGVNSLFIEPDTHDIICKLRSLRDSPTLRSFLGRRLSVDIQSWDWSIRAQPYRQMFAEMLNGKTSEIRTIRNNTHLMPNVAAPLCSRPLAASVEGQQVREALRQKATANLSHLPDDFISKHQELELTVVMLSYGRLNRTLNAINALKDNVHIPFKLVLVDNNSGEEVQTKLAEVCSEYDFIELFRLNKNLGCAGGRMYGLDKVETEYVMFLDNDVEVLPGAVEHLLHSLEQHPELVAAAGEVVFPDGSIHLCGADFWIKDEVLFYELLAAGKCFDDPLVGDSGFCKWVSGGATVFRRRALTKHGLNLAMRAYYEDLEWCFRMNKAGLGSFYRNVHSLVIHFHQSALPDISLSKSERRRQSMKYIETIARFYKIHGKIIQNLFDFVPDLGLPTTHLSVSSAKTFLDLMNTYGADWVLDKWNEDELAPLFPPPPPPLVEEKTETTPVPILSSATLAKQTIRHAANALSRWSRFYQKKKYES